MSTIAEIAEAVKTALNSAAPGTFAQSFTAVRKYIPAELLEDLGTLKITVVPKSSDITNETRRSVMKERRIDIGIQKRVTADPTATTANATIDPLILFVEAVTDYFRPGTGKGIAETGQLGSTDAIWVRTTNEPIYDPEQLVNNHVFQSVVTLTFKQLD